MLMQLLSCDALQLKGVWYSRQPIKCHFTIDCYVSLYKGGKLDLSSDRTDSLDREAQLLHRIRQVEELNELLMQRLR